MSVINHDLAGVGTGGSSKRLAAYKAAIARKENGKQLGVGDVEAILAYQAEGRESRQAGNDELKTSSSISHAAPTLAATLTPSRPTAPQITGQHVHLAAEQARKAERDRWAKVFASEHSKGRERGCAKLLARDENWTAGAIVAQLPNLPTDAMITEEERAARAQAAGNVWETAHARLPGNHAAVQPTGDNGNVWERAIAANNHGRDAVHAEIRERRA